MLHGQIAIYDALYLERGRKELRTVANGFQNEINKYLIP
jgi:hypothetical protein